MSDPAAATTLALLAAGAAACAAPAAGGGALPRTLVPPAPPGSEQPELVVRLRWLWAVLAGVGAWGFLGGVAGVVAAPLVAGATGVMLGRMESPAQRRRRELAGAQLPHLVALIGCGLRAGAAPDQAVRLACQALPGPAADDLAPVLARLRLGTDPAQAWAQIAARSAVGPLGRTLARAHRSGSSVLLAIDRLSHDLARERRSSAEQRARTVGVRAAVPLGVCLLPSFVLIGVVPMVAGLARSLAW